jgi:D-alanyl-D-alanine carboxypeptidase/D-alanyl-D-alanine-endopeptidase (penicillin-binding protein 4)
MNQEANEYFKTGTLSDVRTHAGYIIGKDKQLYPYVIMINQAGRSTAVIKQHLFSIVNGR